jgi:hypothetical protein
MSKMDPILLSASRIVGAGTVEGSGVQGEEDRRYQMHGGIPQKKMERLSSKADMSCNAL